MRPEGGNDRSQEDVTLPVSLVAPAIFVNLLLLSPQRKLEVNVLMAQGAIRRGVNSAAMEVVNQGSVNDDPTKPIQRQVGDIQVPYNVHILSARDLRDSLCVGVIASVAEEGHEASQGVVVAWVRVAR